MNALAIICVVQAVALGAVCLRLAWPHDDEGRFLDHVGGNGIQQSEEELDEVEETRLGFRR